MVSFEIFAKAMPPSLLELKVLPSFCFPFKIPEDRAVTTTYMAFTVQNVWTQLIVQVRATLLVLKLSPLFLGKNK